MRLTGLRLPRVRLSRLAVVSAALLGLAVAARFAPVHAAEKTPAEKPAAVKAGDAAPDITLPGVGLQENWSLAKDGKGKIVVVSFDSFKCPVAEALRERWTKLASTLGGDKVAFVSVFSNSAETMDAVKTWHSANKIAITSLRDDGNKVADAYGATNTPHIYVIDTTGKIAYVGAIDDDWEGKAVTKTYVADAVNELLAGKPVTTAATKAVGCSLKRAK